MATYTEFQSSLRGQRKGRGGKEGKFIGEKGID